MFGLRICFALHEFRGKAENDSMEFQAVKPSPPGRGCAEVAQRGLSPELSVLGRVPDLLRSKSLFVLGMLSAGCEPSARSRSQGQSWSAQSWEVPPMQSVLQPSWVSLFFQIQKSLF